MHQGELWPKRPISFFNHFPLLLLRTILYINKISTSIGKVVIFMTYLAFEWDLLVIQLLNMAPVIHFELDGFRKAISKVHFNIDLRIGLHVFFWFVAINIFSDYIPNSMNQFNSPTMVREMMEPDLNRNNTRNI